MTIKKDNFIEIEFTGKIAETGEIFDTNIKSDAKKANLNIKNIKPFILSIGNKMLPGGFDEDLIGKKLGKGYILRLKPEKAFGKRDQKMIRMIPTRLFHQQEISPQRGMQLNLDGQLVKVLSSSGGRTLVDFNNPLAGKEVLYSYKINRLIKDEEEKIRALQDFLFKRIFEFEIKDKKLIFKIKKDEEPLIKLFESKFEDLLNLKVEIKIIENKEKKNSKVSKKE
tara:strand:+ start:6047 stop:6721 length:675 start_codon:yes stop_codon:yes gene_type:complete